MPPEGGGSNFPRIESYNSMWKKLQDRRGYRERSEIEENIAMVN
jgi:hypothetical protein